MNKVLFSLIGFFAVTSAYAETGYDAVDLFESWGGGNFYKCDEHNTSMNMNIAIGASLKDAVNNCKEGSNLFACGFELNDLESEDKVKDYAYQMMIAKDVNPNGAYFCPVQVSTSNWESGSRSHLKYVQLSDNCRWLCKEGFSGVGCQDTVTTFCDAIDFKQANYDGLEFSDSRANIAESIAQFLKKVNRYKICVAKWRQQEHNIVLAVTDWAPGGHGAWVMPTVIRARFQKGGDENRAWPAVYPVSAVKPTLVCVSGYAPNTAKTDCVQINSGLCAHANCPVLANQGYDGTIHAKYMPAGKECPDFRCKNNNQAFASVTDKTCVSCPSSMRVGVSPIDGTCVSCEQGTVFNGRATSLNQLCKPAIRLTKMDMQYGFGYTKNSKPDVADQCWILGQIDEYRACVLANVSSATTITVSGSSVSTSASRLKLRPSVILSGTTAGVNGNTDAATAGQGSGSESDTGGQQNPGGGNLGVGTNHHGVIVSGDGQNQVNRPLFLGG